MSLFNVLDLWTTHCGVDESFGFDSLLCTDFESSDRKIIVGSLSGFLRIYEVDFSNIQQCSYKPSDLLLETQLSSPILQIAVGKLVSGSRAMQIAVAHPRSITVYNLHCIPGSTEHGNQYELKIVYEHPLQHSNFQLIIGPFGGVKGRDFLCSFALDGTLTFFEQETFIHETQLPTFLLPSPMVYVPEADLFVTLSADWYVEGYRYQDLVNAAGKRIVPAWSYNLGETVLGIKSYKSQESIIAVLSEHNFTCFNSKGVVKFTKRLQYSPLCFHVFVKESTNDYMMIVVSDSGVMFLYEKTTLRWSAKLPIIPISVVVANLGMRGILVLLSEHGVLHCSYLGTKPTLFVAPPMENSITNYKNVEPKLKKLEDQIKEIMSSNAQNLTLEVDEHEIAVAVKILPYDKSLNYCQLSVELTPSRPLTNIQITFNISIPFMMKPECYTLSSLCEKAILNASIQIENYQDVIATNLNVTVIVSYLGKKTPRVIRKSANLSARFVLSACAICDDKNTSKLTIFVDKPPLPLTVVFQDFRGSKWIESGNNDEVANFGLTYNPEIKCTVSLCKTSHGYEFASNSLLMIYLLMKQVIEKCKSHKIGANVEEFRFDCKCIPKNELKDAIENHVNLRNEIRGIQVYLEKLSSQYRLIQRRFLIKLKENVLKPSTGLQILYKDIYEKLLETIKNFEIKEKLLICSNELQTVIDLTLDCIAMNSSIQSTCVDELRNALLSTSLIVDSQGWEERTYANVIYLLKTGLSSSNKDQLLVLPPSDKVVDDFNQFWRIISIAFDRISNNQFSISLKLDQTRKVTPIKEDEEEEEVKEKKIRFKKHEKLLLKRRPCANANVIEHLNDID